MSTLDSGHTHLDGDQTPTLAVSDGVNGIDKLHGHSHPSPATDSPATPVSTTGAPDVKIDMDYQEQESDARHEPLPIRPIDAVAKLDDASTAPQVGSPVDPSTIPVHVPQGTPPPATGDLLEDVKMAENGRVNGHDDISMSDDTPAATPGISTDFSKTNLDGATSQVRSYPDEHDDEEEPPAKRARMHSEGEAMSQHSPQSPPPTSAAMSSTASPRPLPSSFPPSTGASSGFSANSDIVMPISQWRFCHSTLRGLKKHKDVGPFLRPVDPVALNIPHYPAIIKHPMDISTIERKLQACNPSKPDPNPNNPRYNNPEEFIHDFRLIIQNTLTFNGPDHIVTQMGKRLEEAFDKAVKHMPVPELPKPRVAPAPKKVTPPPPPPPPAPVVKKAAPRRSSTSVPVIRRSEPEQAIGRPKREIHPPAPKDLPYADAPKKARKAKRVNDARVLEQLKFCGKILQELHKKSHYRFAHPFYEPVDWVKLDIPDYPTIIKKPMDLSTMRKKLDNGDYTQAKQFYDDFKLMIRNCFQFNPSGTIVNQAGIELQRLFDEKWKALPPLHEPSDDDDDDDEELDSDEERERLRAIAQMESKLESMRNEVANMRNQKLKKKKEPPKREKPPVASTSKPAPAKAPKAPSKKPKKKTVNDDDVLTFDQKKDLSDAIGKLEGSRLERVIQIIHEGVPEIRDSTEEIELEIDQLPPAVLTKLYNFVLRPLRQPTQNKRSRSGKGTGTGGLKRKSMDEEKEAEKIRQLEQRVALFEQGTSAATLPPRTADSDHSSDSSDSDSSGSDSD